jgi:integrase
LTASKSTTKPEKPYHEYPLHPHKSGQWRKKYKGKHYHCGPWADPSGALREWERIRNEIELGNDPRPKDGDVTVDLAVNLFLDAKNAKVQSGDLAKSTFGQYKLVSAWLKENLGEHRLVETLGPHDFMRLRSKFPSDWTTTTICNQIVVIRTIMKWLYDNEVIDKPIRYGDNFSKPSAKRRKLERASKPKKEFSSAEIWKLHKYASTEVKAWILLGVNCGYGNSDLSRLRVSDVRGEWLETVRGKTGEPRKAWLWKETRAAIAEVLKTHPGGELLFTNSTGGPLVSDDGVADAVAHAFGALKRDCGLHRRGVGFYALRHVFETVGGDSKDQVCVDYVMGHSDETMAGVYRESVFEKRIKAVCMHVHKWLMKGKPTSRRLGVKGGVE